MPANQCPAIGVAPFAAKGRSYGVVAGNLNANVPAPSFF